MSAISPVYPTISAVGHTVSTVICLLCCLFICLKCPLSIKLSGEKTYLSHCLNVSCLSKCQLSPPCLKCQLSPPCLKCQLSIPLSISGSSRSSGSWKTRTNLKSGKWLVSRWVCYLVDEFIQDGNLFFMSSHNLYLMSSQPWQLYQGWSKGWC